VVFRILSAGRQCVGILHRETVHDSRNLASTYNRENFLDSILAGVQFFPDARIYFQAA
jgi:hypothetical protein